MKIALLGYGKMGKAIENLAMPRGHEISLRIGKERPVGLNDDLSKCDVAIDFSSPDAAFDNIMLGMDAGIPVISGSTGWLDRMSEVQNRCLEIGGAFIYGSNFSIGVNLFFALNRTLARLMSKHQAYNADILEIHHTTKKDAPSGTAISLAEDMISEHVGYSTWKNEEAKTDNVLPIISKRIADAPGTHIISYNSEIDEIEIRHEAKSRDGFALGALLAAEWIQGKHGIYTMRDVLGM